MNLKLKIENWNWSFFFCNFRARLMRKLWWPPRLLKPPGKSILAFCVDWLIKYLIFFFLSFFSGLKFALPDTTLRFLTVISARPCMITSNHVAKSRLLRFEKQAVFLSVLTEMEVKTRPCNLMEVTWEDVISLFRWFHVQNPTQSLLLNNWLL